MYTMKKRILNFLAITAIVALASSCKYTVPQAASSAKMDKQGTSETISIFNIDLNQNYGIKEAAKSGKITGGIATVDEKVTIFPVVPVKIKKLVVTGE